MFNVTKAPLPSSVIDTTPMVLLVMAITLLFFLSFLIGEASKGEKWENIGACLMCILIAVAIFMNFMLIKISIDSGIEWERNRSPEIETVSPQSNYFEPKGGEENG